MGIANFILAFKITPVNGVTPVEGIESEQFKSQIMMFVVA